MEFSVAGARAYAYSGGRAFDATRPAVAFIHGGAQDHSVWILQSRSLAHRGYGVLAPDLPGHGRSGGAPLARVADMADWTVALLDAAGVRTAALVGHSMGSLVALDCAARHPQRVTGIALLGAAFPMRVSPALLGAARDDEAAAQHMINVWSHSAYAHYPGNPGPGFWVIGENLRLLQRQKPGVLHADFAACNSYADGLERAARIRCPALLVLGKRDLMTPARAATDLRRTIPGATSIVLEDCGHSLMAEKPDAVLRRETPVPRPRVWIAFRKFRAGCRTRPRPAWRRAALATCLRRLGVAARGTHSRGALLRKALVRAHHSGNSGRRRARRAAARSSAGRAARLRGRTQPWRIGFPEAARSAGHSPGRLLRPARGMGYPRRPSAGDSSRARPPARRFRPTRVSPPARTSRGPGRTPSLRNRSTASVRSRRQRPDCRRSRPAAARSSPASDCCGRPRWAGPGWPSAVSSGASCAATQRAARSLSARGITTPAPVSPTASKPRAPAVYYEGLSQDGVPDDATGENWPDDQPRIRNP